MRISVNLSADLEESETRATTVIWILGSTKARPKIYTRSTMFQDFESNLGIWERILSAKVRECDRHAM